MPPKEFDDRLVAPPRILLVHRMGRVETLDPLDPLDEGEQLFEAIGQPQQKRGTNIETRTSSLRGTAPDAARPQGSLRGPGERLREDPLQRDARR